MNIPLIDALRIEKLELWEQKKICDYDLCWVDHNNNNRNWKPSKKQVKETVEILTAVREKYYGK